MKLLLPLIENLLYIVGSVDGNNEAMENVVTESIVLNACTVKPIFSTGGSASVVCLPHLDGLL
jgi:hypothetical protein